jgi:O-antigen ligase
MLKKIFNTGLILLPVFFLSVKHATNIILFSLAITSLVFINKIYREKLYVKFTRKNYLIVILILVFPVLAIAISQTLRQEYYPNNWDSPLRFFLCLPIFFAISQGCLSGKNSRTISEIWLCWSMPIAIFVMLISRMYYPAKNWGAYLTTYFVDPLTFCSYALLFSLLSISGLVYFNKKMSKFNILFSLISIVVGLYLSISSGARTGWLGLPLIIIILWRTLKTEFDIKKANVLIFILLMIMGLLIYYNSNFLNKLLLALQQFSSYKLNELNIDTSVGMRLSFYRMGIQYFIERPWYGWGDLSWMNFMNRAEFIQYASEFTRESPKHGFHNEIITSSVRSGIWGLMASVCLFVGVTYLAIKGMCIKISIEHRAISFTLFVVIVHLFFTSFTTEITNLTFLSAFIGIIISVLLGEKIQLEESNNK